MVQDDDRNTKNGNRTDTSRRWWGWILAAYWGMLFTATHLPPSVPLMPGAGVDKLAHLAAYALLALLVACYWQASAG